MTLTRPQQRWLVGFLVVIDVVSWALAWRDLARRPAVDSRGRRNGWRVFITLNPGNALVYRLVGRRSHMAAHRVVGPGEARRCGQAHPATRSRPAR